MKRLLALALSIILVSAPLTISANAGFSDIADSAVARDVAVLQLMGVLDGFPDGSFRPSGLLTRAQFTKMAVAASQTTSNISNYANQTIFPDVRASHWAAGYINYAVKNGLLIGLPDGSFSPEENITYAQAVTILMRVLGYTDADLGGNWPVSYMNQAGEIGLTDGISASYGSAVTRAQAARLFRNLLSCVTKGGSATFLGSIASTVTPGVILTSLNAVADDGTKNCVSTAGSMTETIKPLRAVPQELLGCTGTIALNKNGLMIAFVPDVGTSSKTIQVASATAAYILSSDGKRITVSPDTLVFADGESKKYSGVWPDIRAGRTLTCFFSASGKCSYIISTASSSASSSVAALTSDFAEGTNPFLRLLGLGQGNYAIYKNGAPATVSDLRKYDVGVYDPVSNAIYVSDLRLSCIYEAASPNKETPTSINALGNEFELLPAAAESLSGMNTGAGITLLLTEDFRVAGVVKGSMESNAIGVVAGIEGGKATVELLSGLTLKGSFSQGSDYTGALVSVRSFRAGELNLTKLTYSSAGKLDLAAKTLGGKSLSPSVRFFDKVGSSPVTEVKSDDIAVGSVPSSSISYVHYDWADRPDIVIMSDVTGDCYKYGFLDFTEGTPGSFPDGGGTSATLSVTNGDGAVTGDCSGIYSNLEGVAGGLVFSTSGVVAGTASLTAVRGVPRSALRDDYFSYNELNMPISANVQCYIKDKNRWTELSEVRAYSDSLTVYYDRTVQTGGKIRLVVAE
ncbi:MAG: S-layer homology domain-containing protein [Oscillospiraceae bacterium]